MEQKKGVKNLILHGGILAMAGIFVRIIGMLYRIPMVNIIGSEANGIYSVAFNIYNIVLVLSSYGLPMAVSKLVSERIADKRYMDAKKVFRSSLIVSVCTGGIAALFLFFGAGFLESHVYTGYTGIAMPLRVLAPTIFIVSMLGVFRGFYQGQGTTIPTAFSQLIEQIINALVSILAGYILVKTFADSANVCGYGAAGGTLGTATGAFAALVFLVILYMIYRPIYEKKISRDICSVDENYIDIFKVIVITIVPIILGQTFYQISATIDDAMFGNIMKNIGTATSDIKKFNGNYNSSYVLLTGVPMGIASAMSASMLPSIVASKTKNLIEDIRDKIRATLKANMMIAIPSSVGLFVLGEAIVSLLFPKYNSAQGGMMLKIGAAAVIFYTISTVTSSALQGINKMNVPVKHSCISLIIHIILVFILLKFTNLGIYALVIGSMTFPIIIMILNLLALYEYIDYKQEIFRTFIIPLLCAIIMGLVTYIVYTIMLNVTGRVIIGLFFGFIAAGISYFAPLLVCKRRGIY